MRAAAVALVLIVGAAVVLWFGNTLSSWVLGGLIGGLAALLLSIPISLALFSYLSRRHDEQLRAEAQEESSPDEFYNYAETAVEEAYETDVYMLPPAEKQWSEEDSYYRAPRVRNLPVPAPYPRLPVPRQNQASEKPLYRPRATEYQLAPERQQGVRANSPRRPTTSRQIRYPGFPGYKVDPQRSSQRTAALRAARQEAIQQQQQYSDLEFYPTAPSKRLPVVRSEQNVVRQSAGSQVPRPSSSLPQPPKQYRQRPTVDGYSVRRGADPALPGAGETSAGQTTENLKSRIPDPQTEQLRGRFAQTGPFRQQPAVRQTGQMRNPQVETPRRNPDNISGSLKNPLVRRAPYMYEDDPLRQELAQHLETPSVRRSSRYESEEN